MTTRKLILLLSLLPACDSDAVETPGETSNPQSLSGCAAPVHAVACENEVSGTSPAIWDVTGRGSEYIRGFSTDISVNRGSTIRFKINTSPNPSIPLATAYHIDIYRIGFYQGNGARLVQANLFPSVSLPQVQPNCLRIPDSGSSGEIVDCGNWAESASWTVPATAVSGVYIAKLVRDDVPNQASHIIFVVRNDASNSDIVFQTSDTTWQAYNSYGGVGLYPGTNNVQAARVSYNRPIIDRGGDGIYGSTTSYFFTAEYPMIRWLESNGYDVSYIAGVDTDRAGSAGTATGVTTTTMTDTAMTWTPGRFTGAIVTMGGKKATVTSNTATTLTFTGGWSGGGTPVVGRYTASSLQSHKAFLSVGHDEYWTARQRSNVEYARSQGVNLAFLSGDEVTWKTHLDPSFDGTKTPHRTLVTYKETAFGGSFIPGANSTILAGARFPAATEITSASGSPIRITTSTPHSLSDGQPIIITGALGNTNANGTWTVTATTTNANQFTLVGSSSNAAYSGGGKASPPWTGQWADPTGSNFNYGAPSDGSLPENALTGTKWVVEVDYRALQVPYYYGDLRLWRNTGLGHGGGTPLGRVCETAGNPTSGCVVGLEWDEDIDNGFRPTGLMRTSSTFAPGAGFDYILDYGAYFSGQHSATHHTTLYRSPPTYSGALVFGAGTINWAWGMDGCHDYDPDFPQVWKSNMSAVCSRKDGMVPRDPFLDSDQIMQQATVNLFADMCNSAGQCIQPRTLQAGLTVATRSSDMTAPTSTLTVSPSPSLGTPTVVTVTAKDVGGVVGGVDVSVDGGATWHPAKISSRIYSSCTAGFTCSTWTYTWMPTLLGSATVKARAADDTGNTETPGAGLMVTVNPRVSELLYFYNGAPSSPSSGLVACGKLSSGGTYVNAGTATIRKGWTHIVSVKGTPMAPVGGVSPGFNNVFLFYDSSTGFSWTAQIDDSCVYSEPAPNGGPFGTLYSPGPGWSHVVAASNNMVLFYDNVADRMMLARLDESGFFSPLSAAKMNGKYTHVVAGVNNVFLFYNSLSGAAETARLVPPANNFVSLKNFTISAGWTNIVLGVNNVFLFFKSSPGNAMSARLDTAGNLTPLQNPLWSADLGWTAIAAGFKNKTLLFYHSPSGTIATGTLSENGTYTSFGTGSGFSTGWTHVVTP